MRALLCASVRDGDKGAMSVVGLLVGSVVPFVRELFVPFRPLLRTNILDSHSKKHFRIDELLFAFFFI